ncbi:hypothetical protein ABH926_005969 [Catenulispora sp. GP43]|uniref:hypothetical protein n=1 Tax=Catenulispora sp. GP43 TaxID=3156263 RepID=UPI003516921F
MIPLIPPSLLNFLAGLAAGAGINLLTSIEGGSHFPRGQVVVDSGLWILDAMLLAYAAHLAETVEREAALAFDNTLSAEEKRDIMRDEVDKRRLRYHGSIVLGVVGMVVSMVLVPGIL